MEGRIPPYRNDLRLGAERVMLATFGQSTISKLWKEEAASTSMLRRFLHFTNLKLSRSRQLENKAGTMSSARNETDSKWRFLRDAKQEACEILWTGHGGPTSNFKRKSLTHVVCPPPEKLRSTFVAKITHPSSIIKQSPLPLRKPTQSLNDPFWEDKNLPKARMTSSLAS